MGDNAPPVIESDSWCRTTSGDKASTTFTWTIEDLFNRPEKKGEFIRSSPFTIAGPNDKVTNWDLKLYPKGDGSRGSDGTRLDVYLKSNNNSYEKVFFSLSILNERHQKESTMTMSPEEYKTLFEECQQGNHEPAIGFAMMSLEELRDSPQLLSNGNLTVMCNLTVFGPEATLSGSKFPEEKVAPVDNCLRQMSKQFGKILGDKKFSDVKIIAGNEEFHCHRSILSGRSPVFEAMFHSDMIENISRIVDMKDIKPEVVCEMLHFIYTGGISKDDVMDEIGRDLLGAADQYQLDLLKNKCEEKLCSSLEVSNSVELLVLADLHQASKLRRMALRLVARNMDTIVDTDIYQDFISRQPTLTLEITKALVQKVGIKRKRDSNE